jgi:hypothetical protein
MKSKSQIDDCDYVAGRHWQAAWENACIGGVRAIDPSREMVDSRRQPEMLTDLARCRAEPRARHWAAKGIR